MVFSIGLVESSTTYLKLTKLAVEPVSPVTPSEMQLLLAIAGLHRSSQSAGKTPTPRFTYARNAVHVLGAFHGYLNKSSRLGCRASLNMIGSSLATSLLRHLIRFKPRRRQPSLRSSEATYDNTYILSTNSSPTKQ
jgi:hypothetical protein